jgi:hypothetical protein
MQINFQKTNYHKAPNQIKHIEKHFPNFFPKILISKFFEKPTIQFFPKAQCVDYSKPNIQVFLENLNSPQTFKCPKTLNKNL